jgi:Flp pilus assembly protein TadD
MDGLRGRGARLQTGAAALLLLPALCCGGAGAESRGAQGGARSLRDDRAVQGPESAEADPYGFYRSVSRTLLRTNQPLEASRSIRRLFKLKPDSPEPYCLMGRAYVAMRQFKSARKMLRGAIEKDEEYAEAHSMLGVVLNHMGQHRLADASHRRAIELEGEKAAFRNNLGFSYYLQGRYQRAVAAYQAALELDPGARRIHNNLGFAHGKLGEMDKARQHFTLAGPPAQASNNLGFVHESRGELERAHDLYLEALGQDPELLQARRNLERMCERLGRPMPDVGVNIEEKEAEGPEPPES